MFAYGVTRLPVIEPAEIPFRGRISTSSITAGMPVIEAVEIPPLANR